MKKRPAKLKLPRLGEVVEINLEGHSFKMFIDEITRERSGDFSFGGTIIGSPTGSHMTIGSRKAKSK